MCDLFGTANTTVPLQAPAPPEAPEAVAKSPVSGVTIKKKKNKAAGIKGPSLIVPRSNVNIPGV